MARMKSAKELAQLIGQRGVTRSMGVPVQVEVVDARNRIGQVDVLVRPIGGRDEDEVWVTLAKVRLDEALS